MLGNLQFVGLAGLVGAFDVFAEFPLLVFSVSFWNHIQRSLNRNSKLMSPFWKSRNMLAYGSGLTFLNHKAPNPVCPSTIF